MNFIHTLITKLGEFSHDFIRLATEGEATLLHFVTVAFVVIVGLVLHDLLDEVDEFD